MVSFYFHHPSPTLTLLRATWKLLSEKTFASPGKEEEDWQAAQATTSCVCARHQPRSLQRTLPTLWVLRTGPPASHLHITGLMLIASSHCSVHAPGKTGWPHESIHNSQSPHSCLWPWIKPCLLSLTWTTLLKCSSLLQQCTCTNYNPTLAPCASEMKPRNHGSICQQPGPPPCVSLQPAPATAHTPATSPHSWVCTHHWFQPPQMPALVCRHWT